MQSEECNYPHQLNTGYYHAVQLIGWGPGSAQHGIPDFWIAANSWGKEWGESGLFRIQRGVNMCHIEEFVTAARPEFRKEKLKEKEKRGSRR